MSFKLLVRFNIKADQVASFVEIMQGAKDQISKAQGCGGVEVLLSADNPGKVVLSEIWDTKEHHDQYAEKMRESGSFDKMAAFLVGPPESEFFIIK